MICDTVGLQHRCLLEDTQLRKDEELFICTALVLFLLAECLLLSEFGWAVEITDSESRSCPDSQELVPLPKV